MKRSNTHNIDVESVGEKKIKLKHVNEVCLRIVHVNDVYEISNLPSLSTLIKREKEKLKNTCCKLIVVLAGDFLAPSVLSSIDHGYAMIETLNSIPVDYVCFGNHECDVPYTSLVKRIKEFNGKWINTNMMDFKPVLPRYDILELTNGDHKRRIAVTGFLLNNKAVYREDVFGGVTNIVDVFESAQIISKELLGDNNISSSNNKTEKKKNLLNLDCILPMTHQSNKEDIQLAKIGRSLGFPVILGGHDHFVHVDTYNDCLLVKTGCDAKIAAVIDIVWDNSSMVEPTITHSLLKVKEFPRDKITQNVVDKHTRKLTLLKDLVLLHFDPPLTTPSSSSNTISSKCALAARWNGGLSNELMSSQHARRQQTTIGSLICDAAVHVLGLDVILVPSGSIRANSSYPEKFTYADLLNELPFVNQCAGVRIPGSILQDAIVHSRRKAPQIEEAGFLQVNSSLRLDEANNIISIAGKPFNKEKIYSAGVIIDLGFGAENEILKNWGELNKAKIPDLDCGRPMKEIFMEYFARLLWDVLPIWSELDANNDGKISQDEILNVLENHCLHESKVKGGFCSTTTTSIENLKILSKFLLDALDVDEDGLISKIEYNSICHDKSEKYK